MTVLQIVLLCQLLYLSSAETLRSTKSDRSTMVKFLNRSQKNVATLWLNYEGEPVKYSTLSPGQSVTQQTYVTHPWIVVEVDSCHFQLMNLNGMSVFFPRQSKMQVDITDQDDVIIEYLAERYHSKVVS